MPFATGDSVHVAALGTGIVRDVRNGGRYLVEIKGRSIVVAADRLTHVESRPAPRAATASRGKDDSSTQAPRSLDLHGKTVDEAVDALDTFLNDSLLEGATKLRIIHGQSGGRLRAAVHARLKLIPSIRAFRLDDRNPGVTIVKL
jgi:dsDNA-specific endonuclease/ATPase MutS2